MSTLDTGNLLQAPFNLTECLGRGRVSHARVEPNLDRLAEIDRAAENFLPVRLTVRGKFCNDAPDGAAAHLQALFLVLRQGASDHKARGDCGLVNAKPREKVTGQLRNLEPTAGLPQ